MPECSCKLIDTVKKRYEGLELKSFEFSWQIYHEANDMLSAEKFPLALDQNGLRIFQINATPIHEFKYSSIKKYYPKGDAPTEKEDIWKFRQSMEEGASAKDWILNIYAGTGDKQNLLNTIRMACYVKPPEGSTYVDNKDIDGVGTRYIKYTQCSIANVPKDSEEKDSPENTLNTNKLKDIVENDYGMKMPNDMTFSWYTYRRGRIIDSFGGLGLGRGYRAKEKSGDLDRNQDYYIFDPYNAIYNIFNLHYTTRASLKHNGNRVLTDKWIFYPPAEFSEHINLTYLSDERPRKVAWSLYIERDGSNGNKNQVIVPLTCEEKLADPKNPSYITTGPEPWQNFEEAAYRKNLLFFIKDTARKGNQSTKPVYTRPEIGIQ